MQRRTSILDDGQVVFLEGFCGNDRTICGSSSRFLSSTPLNRHHCMSSALFGAVLDRRKENKYKNRNYSNILELFLTFPCFTSFLDETFCYKACKFSNT